MRSVLFALSLSSILLLPPTLPAATIHVPADEPTIQSGIDAAMDGDLVLVEPGIYSERIDFSGKEIVVQGEGGAGATIIDGGQTGAAVTFENGESNASVLSGFTIRNGFGSGIKCTNASAAMILACEISGNQGFGIICNNAPPTRIANCTISENTGGGIRASNTMLRISNCRVSENNSTASGGGVSLWGSSSTIENCTITGNSAVTGGGIFCDHYSSATIENCLISGNNATSGGGIYCNQSSPTVTNCTISGNTADAGGGIYCTFDSSPTVENSILRDDSADEGPEIRVGTAALPSTLTVRYSDVAGGEGAAVVDPASTLLWLDGNIDDDPLFTGPDDYHLAAGSPCIDAGEPSPSFNDQCFPPSMGMARNDMGSYGGQAACGWICWDNDDDGFNDLSCGGFDCDDTNPAVNPDSTEVCANSLDDDCDGAVDEDVDEDGDGYSSCADVDADCDDSNPGVYPGANELCNGIDDDCDGVVPDEESDQDQDGWRICAGDCNDLAELVYPAADEVCDGLDNDCNDEIPGDEVDMDGDGWMVCAGDCDDGEESINPGAYELCDHIDNDCDGDIDEGVTITYYLDGDGDGFGDPAGTVEDCDLPPGYVEDNTDCNDNEPDVHPGATEGPYDDPSCSDGLDNDCDGLVDMDEMDCSCQDDDGDGYYNETCGGDDCDDDDPEVNPGEWERCFNGIDDDCDGLIDDEQMGCLTIHVPADQSTIQAGIDVAFDGDTVLVAPGTYFERIDFLGKNVRLRSEAGAGATIINGLRGGSVVTFATEESGGAVLDGFTISFGRSDRGGGIWCSGETSPTIENCRITRNNAEFGAGICCSYDASPLIKNCLISDNKALGIGFDGPVLRGDGGGIACINASPTIDNCTISRNWSLQDGGGIYVDEGSPMISNCEISKNTASLLSGYGGGLSLHDSSSVIENCRISENTAHTGGGFMIRRTVGLVIQNCTVSRNVSYDLGGGICLSWEADALIRNTTIFMNQALRGGGGISAHAILSNPVITSSVLWGNSALQGPELWMGADAGAATLTVRYSDVRGGEDLVYLYPDAQLYWQEGNIDEDPQFTGDGDFHLGPGSPCIDAGDPETSHEDECFPPSLGTGRNDQGAYGGPAACGWCGDRDDDGFDNAECDGDDCNDADAATYPGADEICDGRDNDCDGTMPADEEDPDGDLWMVCSGDCDETDPEVNPGHDEVPANGIDDDCDGEIDESCFVVGILSMWR